MNRNVAWIVMAALSASSLLVSGCAREGEASSAETMTVRRGAFVDRIVLTGEVEAAEAAVLSVPRLPRWQTSIRWIAESGTTVNAGDKIVELDNSEFAKTLKDREEARLQMLQSLEQRRAEATADIARKQFEVERRLLEFEKAKIAADVPLDILPAREHQERQLALEKAERELAKARKDLLAARGSADADLRNLTIELQGADRDIEVARRAVEELILRAPAAGLLILGDHPWEGRPLQQGDSVWVGLPLAQIPDLSTLQIVASLADVDDGAVRTGMPVTVTLDAWPGRSFRGTITDVAPVAQEVRGRSTLRRSFRVVVALDESDIETMKPGYSARVDVTRRTIPDALLVPRAAVDWSGDSPRIRTRSGMRDVTLDGCNALDCVVKSGVEDGLSVVSARGVR